MKKPLVLMIIFSLFFLTACGPVKEVVREETLSVKVYFGNTNFNPNMLDCGAVYPLERTIPMTQDKVGLTLKSLFAGPTALEKQNGYSSWFSPLTADILNGVTIANGRAQVDLKDIRQIIPNASASCGSAELLAEMEATLLQFSEINEVIFSINGDSTVFYEWLQLTTPTP